MLARLERAWGATGSSGARDEGLFVLTGIGVGTPEGDVGANMHLWRTPEEDVGSNMEGCWYAGCVGWV